MDFDSVLFAFGLSLFAGLSTGIGSAIAFFTKRTNTSVLSLALGLSAGVMIYISFMEILPESMNSLVKVHGEKTGKWYSLASFFGGILLIALIDKLIPSYENPHEVKKVEAMDDEEKKKKSKLMRLGVFSAIAIAIHNFPEGIATFAAGLNDPTIAIPIAIAVAIHNIPEGIAVSVPIYYATGSRKKAFLHSFLSGLAEPFGAFFAYLVLFTIFDDTVMGILFGSIAGIMVFISLDELLPTAREYGKPHLAIYGIVAGMMIMAISLILLH